MKDMYDIVMIRKYIRRAERVEVYVLLNPSLSRYVRISKQEAFRLISRLPAHCRLYAERYDNGHGGEILYLGAQSLILHTGATYEIMTSEAIDKWREGLEN